MFGKKHHQGKRSPNIPFVIFRLFLSLTMFMVLLVGVYVAYKQFSGLDPLKLDPQAVISELLAGKIPTEILDLPIPPKNPQKNSEPAPNKTAADLAFRFLVVADSHNDNTNLGKAIDQARAIYPDLSFIIGLGDYTEIGTVEDLKKAKEEFDRFGLRYFLIPGDHDLWDCRNRVLPPTDCFKQVFGPNYQTFIFEGFKFLLLDNSDAYTGFDSGQLRWIADELERGKQEGLKGIFVFLHTPLYHPSSDHVMGRVEKSLKLQADGLIFQLKAGGVNRVFAGDTHYFSETSEPKTKMPMVTTGAVAIDRNPQAPRFAVVSVFEDGSTKVEDIEIR